MQSIDYKEYFKDVEIIDSHTHLHNHIDPKTGDLFLGGFDPYQKEYNVKAFNVASLSCKPQHGVADNIFSAFYKLYSNDIFAHGGFFYSIPEKSLTAPDVLTQYLELMDLGFDGIKMLEAKPNVYKVHNLPLCGPFYEPFFAQAEKDQVNLLFHVSDPEDFWDKSKLTKEMIDLGWYYGDGTFVSYSDMYDQIDSILNAHPDLKATFAHFYFCSKNPEKIEEMFKKYKNVAIDVTPGIEMYDGFKLRPDYYYEFFRKYSDRILFGTDGSFPTNTEAYSLLSTCAFHYLATDKIAKSWCGELKGINLEKEHLDKIFSKNYIQRVGDKPREINKQALKKYIDKYMDFIPTSKQKEDVVKLSKRFL